MSEEHKPPTQTVRLDAELVRKMRIVCAHAKDDQGKQMKLTDYLDSIVREHVTRDHAAIIKRIAKGQED